MNKLTDADAAAHPSYDAGVHRAAVRAYEDKGACFSVYFDGVAIYVRASTAAPPPNAKLICIAQHWRDSTVQLRFTGARSEWVNF